MSIHISDHGSSAQVKHVSSLITQTLDRMIDTADAHMISMKVKAISTIIPFAISLERDGQQGMLDVAVCSLRSFGGDVWSQAQRHIDTLFKETSAHSLNQAITLISPYWGWSSWKKGENEVARWATAVLNVPYTKEVGQSVVDATLQIASHNFLRPHIPIKVWALFKKQPPLSPICLGRSNGNEPDIIKHVRGLGDLEILKSFLLLVWSEWDRISSSGLDMMKMLIQEDFCGIGMAQHQQDLLQRLDYILGEFGRGPEYFQWHTMWSFDFIKARIEYTKQQYGELRDVLLEVQREAVKKTLTCMSPSLSLPVSKFILMAVVQGTTQHVPCPSHVHDFMLKVVDISFQCFCATICLIISSFTISYCSDCRPHFGAHHPSLVHLSEG